MQIASPLPFVQIFFNFFPFFFKVVNIFFEQVPKNKILGDLKKKISMVQKKFVESEKKIRGEVNPLILRNNPGILRKLQSYLEQIQSNLG